MKNIGDKDNFIEHNKDCSIAVLFSFSFVF